jgi:hypothetical protein
LTGVSAERFQRHPGRRKQVATDGNETPRRNRERASREPGKYHHHVEISAV